jgi:mannose-6-phosphate isomerase-like protein (cupin superfamily)
LIDEFVIRRFDQPDEMREFPMGRFEVVSVAGVQLGRAIYEPGWRWSEHVGDGPDARCQSEHVGIVLQGRAFVAGDGYDGEMRSGDIFAVPPGHDSWVVGEQAYISLHIHGADRYAR